MSINIWTDSMQHAALLGKPVLFTNWLIQRDNIRERCGFALKSLTFASHNE